LKRKPAAVLILLLAAVLLAACSFNSGKSFTYSIETGSSVTVRLDTTDGLDLQNDDGIFSVVDGSGEEIVQGAFSSQEAFDELSGLVKESLDCTILEEDANGLIYVVYGSTGWETNRIVKLADADASIVMGSLSDSSAAVEAYHKLTFSVNKTAEVAPGSDKGALGNPVWLIAAAAAAAVLIAALLLVSHKKRSHFEYYFDEDELKKKETIEQMSSGNESERDGETQLIFCGGDDQTKACDDEKESADVKLTVVSLRSLESNEEYDFEVDSVVSIGRSKKKSRVIIENDKHVSGLHCEVFSEGGKIMIRDAGSTNGTWVNGEEIHAERELHSGDILKLGIREFEVRVR